MKISKLLFRQCAAVILAAFCFATAPVFASAEGDVETIYVSPSAAPGGNGSITYPFASINEAKEEVRRIRNDGKASGVTVYLRGGTYDVGTGLRFTQTDGGSEDFAVKYTAYRDEKVILSAANHLDGKAFTEVTDTAALGRIPEIARKKVMQLDLRAAGLTSAGIMREDRYMSWSESSPILSVNGEMQTVARWPNAGWAWTGRVIDNREGSSQRVVQYTENVGAKWSTAPDPRFHGFGSNLYADQDAQVRIDTTAKTLTMNTSSLPYDVGADVPYYLYNMLEELDMPGEWYVDRQNMILYLYPKDSLDTATVEFTTASTTLVTLDNASYITFDGLTFEGTTGLGVSLTNSSHDNLITNCEFRHTGRAAVMMSTLANHNSVTWCHMYDLPKMGVAIQENTSDFATQSVSANNVENCHIENFGRYAAGYLAAIRVYSIGNHIAHNRINGGDSNAIYMNGNENVVEYNEIYDMVKEMRDMGTIYCWSDWTNLGHRVENNYIHDVWGLWKDPEGAKGVHTRDDYGLMALGIYFDDAASDATIKNNVLVNVNAGIFTNGGQRHTIDNNLVVNAQKYGLNITTWNDQTSEVTEEINKSLMESVKAGYEEWSTNIWGDNGPTDTPLPVNHRYRQLFWNEHYVGHESVYNEKYPWLENFLTEDNPFIPQLNKVTNNVCVGEVFPVNTQYLQYGVGIRTQELVEQEGTVDKNLHIKTASDVSFVDAAEGNYTLDDASAITGQNPDFQVIDVTQTGPEGESGLTVGEFDAITPFATEQTEREGTVLLTWERSSGANLYRLVVADNPEFNNPIVDETLTHTYYTVKDIQYTTKLYYWKVEASSTSHAYVGTRANANGTQMISFRNFVLNENQLGSILANFATEIDAEAGQKYLDASSSERAYITQKVAEELSSSTTDIELADMLIDAVRRVDLLHELKAASASAAQELLESNYERLDITTETYTGYITMSDADKDAVIDKLLETISSASTPADMDEIFANAIGAVLVENESKPDNPSSGNTGSSGSSSSSGRGSGGRGGGISLGGGTGTGVPSNQPQQDLDIPASEKPYSDMETAAWAEDAVMALTRAGIVNGREDGRFYPNQTVTREEAVKIIVLGFGLSGSANIEFEDVPEGAWYHDYIATAVACDVIGGISDSAFGSGIPVSRQDMMVMLQRAAKYKGLEVYPVRTISFTDQDAIASYAADAVNTMGAAGIIDGRDDGSFDPKATATRAETAAMCYRLFIRVALLNQ